mmetsp:Transcript_9236/g.12254  ORF Transcript_9236/g.12254 Transcript_9236/m.12254 type:complete len:292 (+) Transcript_9236:112-987(+)
MVYDTPTKDPIYFEEGLHEDSSESPSTVTDTELEDLTTKIETLEYENEEAERALYTISKLHDDKSKQIEKIKLRLEDEAQTSHAVIKDLLIQEHEESAVLQKTLHVLQKKRRKFALKAVVASIFVLLLAAAVGRLVVDKMKLLDTVCAPAQPGTRIQASDSESGKMFVAPWWAPSPVKKPLFGLFCGERPRVQLQMQEDHNLIITHWAPSKSWDGSINLSSPLLVERESADTVTLESDRLIIVTKQGGRKEIQAPWIAKLRPRGMGMGEFCRLSVHKVLNHIEVETSGFFL